MKKLFTNSKLFQKLIIALLIILLNIFSSIQKTYASHAAGTDLTYTYIGNSQYILEVSFYRDCAGINEPDSAAILCSAVSCNQNVTVYAYKVSGTGDEITTPCNAALTTCNGGSLTGIKRFVYRKIVTLSACSDWVFSFQECCRNCSITTINNPCGNNSELYVEARLNNILAPGNSSPSFSNLPVAFICLGQNFTYNHGVLDADNDSLSYTLIAPKTSASTSVSYISPASATNPIKSSTPFTFNSITGDINLTPNAIQIGVMAVLVREYRNGQLIGSVIRDMQVYTQNCNNVIPSASGINNTNNFSVTVCPDQTICFDIYSADADVSQNVTVTTNNGIAGATYSISGGNRPSLHFCWTPTYADANLLPNTFTVTVRDNACPSNGVQTFSYSIFVPSPYFNINSTSVSCYGGSDGTALATSVYGNTYAYSWNTNPVTTSAMASGLAAGAYTVVVSDNSQCTATAVVNISQPDELNLSYSKNDISCYGGCNGSINLTVTGGTAPFQFLWSDGSTSEDMQNLCFSNYLVTVTDANGCSSTLVVDLDNPDELISSMQSVNVSCFNATNGSIDLEVDGGIPPYTYNWSNGSSSQDLSGIAAGTYMVTIYDANLCNINQQITLIQTNPLILVLNGYDATCHGNNDGLIDLEVTGGAPGYNYTWSDGSTTQDISGLLAGVYTVTVYDNYQCSAIMNVSISEPAMLFDNIISTDGNCSNFGSADLSVGGGTQPYQYLWSTGETTEDIANLPAGTFTVTITDAHGCLLIDLVTITISGASIVINASPVDVDCAGNASGNVYLNISGGISPFSFLWSDGTTSQDLLLVVAGTYTVSVTDSNGCQQFAIAEIIEPPLLNASVLVLGDACKGKNAAMADLNVSGGTEPYTFLWSTGETTEDIYNLADGTYMVTVTDAKGCVINLPVIVSNAALLVTFNVNHVSCFGGNDGTVNTLVSGGSAPYDFLWSDGATTAALFNRIAGTYFVVITDQAKCEIIAQIIITEPAALTVNLLVQNLTCLKSGSIVPLVSGGSEPYTYLWSNGETSSQIDGLLAGNYTLSLTDANGCSITASTFVDLAVPIAITFLSTDESFSGASDGSIDITITGGIAPFTYTWSNGATTEDLSSLSNGQYEIVVVDAQGCMVKALISINTLISNGVFEVENNFSLVHYPNPATTIANLIFTSKVAAAVKINLFTMEGKLVDVLFDGDVEGNSKNLLTYNIQKLNPGLYFVNIWSGARQYSYKLLINKE